MEDRDMQATGVAGADARKRQLVITVATALFTAVVFQAKTMAYNNYSLWRIEFMAIEWLVALAASFGANLAGDRDERGANWAASFVPTREGWLYQLLSKLPAAVLRGAIITAFLSIPNATVVPTMIYRETIGNPVIAVIVRFLADVPTGIVCSLLSRHVAERRMDRRAEKTAV